MTTTQSTRDELRSILLGYRAELSQGLNELATGKSAEEFYGEKLEQLFASYLQAHITADRKRMALEARIDTATDILYGFSRTYKQEVTDSAGNVYVNESHGYISKYEVQELVAELKAQQEEV